MPDTADDALLFPKDAAIWRYCSERSALTFGPAAAILQIAHPRIARGVADHSNFRTNTAGRLTRTLRSVNRVAFGTVAEANTMKKHLQGVHQQVSGSISSGMAGPNRYSAFEPDLLLWVLATLIWGAIQGHELIHGPQSATSKEAFYRDMRTFGTYFGLDETVGPACWESFERYMQEQFAQPWLGNPPLSAELAAAIVYPHDRWYTKLLGLASDFLPIETLPAPVRQRLRLVSTPSTRGRMRWYRKWVPILFPKLPPSCACSMKPGRNGFSDALKFSCTIYAPSG